MIRINGQSEVIAVVHPAGNMLRVVIATSENRRLRLLDACEIPAGADAASALAGLRSKHGVARTIGVLPASSVVCRTCTLPDADDEQLEQALRLQAEVHLLGNTPEHRLAMAVQPGAPGETNRSGLVFAWPESGENALIPVEDATYAPDIAGLVALMDTTRPADPMLWLDRDAGAIALGVTHAGGAMFRGTREETSSPDQWQTAVNRVLAETVLSVGHTGAYAESLVRAQTARTSALGPRDAKLFLPDEILASAARHLDGAPTDRTWWSQYGVAAGVAMAAKSELASLTELRGDTDEELPSRFVRIGHALSRPRTAMITAVVCLIVAALLPVAMSGMRLGALHMRHPEIDAETKTIRETKTQLAMYRALDDQAWSMTKVLSDIVSCTPEGIELDVIRVQQSDGTFAISGEARPHDGRGATEIVTLMTENLRDTRLFSEIRPTWGDPNAYRHYQFDLSAKVLRPHRTYEYPIELDYAKWSLAHRQAKLPPPDLEEGDEPDTALANADTAGDDPAPTTPVAAPRTPPTMVADTGSETTTPPRDTSRPRTTRGPREGAIGIGPAEGTSELSVDRHGGGPPPNAIVQPLSKAQIAALTIEEVNSRLPEVAKARSSARRQGEMELATQLKEEFDLLMERKRSGR